MAMLKTVFVTTIMATPVLIFIRIFLPDTLPWYQSFSVGIVSAMLAGHWVRAVSRD